MKHLRWLVALIMAMVMLAASPLQLFAASKTNYISEIRIGYGDDGKKALEQEGFTVWTNLNANEDGNGSAVWLGYKTTTDESEAITDISLMNMKGGYSFDAYLEELEDLNRQVTEQLANFDATIKEFRENYNSGNLFAAQALKSMNLFTEDDTLDENGNPTPVGDLLLDADTPTETLHRIFLEGNTEAISAIEQALAVACTEPGDDNVLSRLEDTEYPSTLDADGNAGRANLKAAFPDFHSAAEEAQNAYEIAENYEGGMEAFLERDDLSEDDAAAYAVRLAYYDLLGGTRLGDSGMTLLEFALLDEEEPDENGEVLEDEYLDMMAQAMTPGQLGIVANVGIMTILINAVAGENYEEAVEEIAEAFEETEQVSVYCGVDRTLFEDTGGIALTSEAYREKAAAEQNDFGKDSEVDDTEATIFASVAAACAAIGPLTFSIGMHLYYSTFGFRRAGYQVVARAFVNFYGTPSAAVTVGGILSITVGVIAIIASVVLMIIAIVKWFEKPKVQKTKYTEIPRAIVEKSESGEFVAYYVARLAGAPEGETDTTKIYGDLNGLNGKDEWVALYYTKNKNAGTPLTEDILISSSNVLEGSSASEYSPVHMFGSQVAANLNQYNTKSGAKAIYVFLRHNEGVAQTGTVFTSGTAILGIVTFLAGGGIAAAITYIVTKKKFKGAEAKA